MTIIEYCKTVSTSIITTLLLIGTLAANAQNDSILLKNGDHLVGEIKEMTKGVLTLKTSYSDSDFNITWLDIQEVSSNQQFLLSLSDGRRVTSSMRTEEDEPQQIVLVESKDNLQVNINDIVFLKSIKDDLFSRLDASLAIGYNFTKNSNLSQFTVRSNVGYNDSKWSLQGGINSVRNSQNDAPSIRRTDAIVSAKLFLRNDWFALLSADFLSNEEQKLKLRSATSGGIGKYFLHSNRIYLSGGAGLAWNNEVFSDALEPTKNSMESFASLELNLFDLQDISLYTSLTLYPSITEKNRIRSDYSLDLSYDLPLDFFVKVGFTHNYDSKPILDASNSDFVIQTTFGWKL